MKTTKTITSNIKYNEYNIINGSINITNVNFTISTELIEAINTFIKAITNANNDKNINLEKKYEEIINILKKRQKALQENKIKNTTHSSELEHIGKYIESKIIESPYPTQLDYRIYQIALLKNGIKYFDKATKYSAVQNIVKKINSNKINPPQENKLENNVPNTISGYIESNVNHFNNHDHFKNKMKKTNHTIAKLEKSIMEIETKRKKWYRANWFFDLAFGKGREIDNLTSLKIKRIQKINKNQTLAKKSSDAQKIHNEQITKLSNELINKMEQTPDKFTSVDINDLADVINYFNKYQSKNTKNIIIQNLIDLINSNLNNLNLSNLKTQLDHINEITNLVKEIPSPNELNDVIKTAGQIILLNNKIEEFATDDKITSIDFNFTEMTIELTNELPKKIIDKSINKIKTSLLEKLNDIKLNHFNKELHNSNIKIINNVLMKLQALEKYKSLFGEKKIDTIEKDVYNKLKDIINDMSSNASSMKILCDYENKIDQQKGSHFVKIHALIKNKKKKIILDNLSNKGKIYYKAFLIACKKLNDNESTISDKVLSKCLKLFGIDTKNLSEITPLLINTIQEKLDKELKLTLEYINNTPYVSFPKEMIKINESGTNKKKSYLNSLISENIEENLCPINDINLIQNEHDNKILNKAINQIKTVTQLQENKNLSEIGKKFINNFHLLALNNKNTHGLIDKLDKNDLEIIYNSCKKNSEIKFNEDFSLKENITGEPTSLLPQYIFLKLIKESVVKDLNLASLEKLDHSKYHNLASKIEFIASKEDQVKIPYQKEFASSLIKHLKEITHENLSNQYKKNIINFMNELNCKDTNGKSVELNYQESEYTTYEEIILKELKESIKLNISLLSINLSDSDSTVQESSNDDYIDLLKESLEELNKSNSLKDFLNKINPSLLDILPENERKNCISLKTSINFSQLQEKTINYNENNEPSESMTNSIENTINELKRIVNGEQINLIYIIQDVPNSIIQFLPKGIADTIKQLQYRFSDYPEVLLDKIIKTAASQQVNSSNNQVNGPDQNLSNLFDELSKGDTYFMNDKNGLNFITECKKALNSEKIKSSLNQRFNILKNKCESLNDHQQNEEGIVIPKNFDDSCKEKSGLINNNFFSNHFDEKSILNKKSKHHIKRNVKSDDTSLLIKQWNELEIPNHEISNTNVSDNYYENDAGCNFKMDGF